MVAFASAYELFASASRSASFRDGCNRVAAHSGTGGALHRSAQRRSGTQGGVGLVFRHCNRRIGARPGCGAWTLSPPGLFGNGILHREICGACLFYLGIKKLRERPAVADRLKHIEPVSSRRVYAQGVLVQVLNPKTAIFFFAFLPQIVNPTRGPVTLQFLAL